MYINKQHNIKKNFLFETKLKRKKILTFLKNKFELMQRTCVREAGLNKLTVDLKKDRDNVFIFFYRIL